MPYDAFDAGIEPGGLRSRSEIKLLVCYLLKSVDKPISRQHINEILQERGLANYFEVNQALTDLLKSDSVTAVHDGVEEVFRITDNGRAAAETLEATLPRSVRDKAVNAAIELLTRVRRERENRIEIERAGAGYQVTFTIFDSSDELLRLTVYVSDSLQAETLRENFLADPVRFYAGIISLLTNGPEEAKPAP